MEGDIAIPVAWRKTVLDGLRIASRILLSSKKLTALEKGFVLSAIKATMI
jgi:hypothetical protein